MPTDLLGYISLAFLTILVIDLLLLLVINTWRIMLGGILLICAAGLTAIMGLVAGPGKNE